MYKCELAGSWQHTWAATGAARSGRYNTEVLNIPAVRIKALCMGLGTD